MRLLKLKHIQNRAVCTIRFPAEPKFPPCHAYTRAAHAYTPLRCHGRHTRHSGRAHTHTRAYLHASASHTYRFAYLNTKPMSCLVVTQPLIYYFEFVIKSEKSKYLFLLVTDNTVYYSEYSACGHRSCPFLNIDRLL